MPVAEGSDQHLTTPDELRSVPRRKSLGAGLVIGVDDLIPSDQ
jgi:hypothetical protein